MILFLIIIRISDPVSFFSSLSIFILLFTLFFLTILYLLRSTTIQYSNLINSQKEKLNIISIETIIKELESRKNNPAFVSEENLVLKALKLLIPNEEYDLIESLLFGSKMNQNELSKKLNLSKVKISRLLTNLENRNIIERVSQGKSNFIVLNKNFANIIYKLEQSKLNKNPSI